jgi:2-alkyl-3-oxoalkanoate reductase
VRAAGPEVIVHQMTALASLRSLRKVDQVFAATNELRTRGTDNLLAAAARAGTRRVIAQRNVAANERSGGPVKTEEDPLASRSPSPSSARTLAAIKHVEETVPLAAAEGIVLRYGGFYGPGASEALLDLVRKRQVPVIGGGTRISSFIEITDAAAATLAAVECGVPGVYSVVDSDPAPVAEWLPYLAKVAGAKPPLRVPAWLGRLLAGAFVVAQMTSWRGASNEKARTELGWEPRYASWREGSVPGSADETGAAGYRPLLFSIAYGMTGLVGDAEDIVQDAFLGLTRARQAGTTITDPKAYLTTAVTRLGINHLRSARVRRETYVGDWLPDPVVVPADAPGPAEHAELADSLSMAFLVLLEALSPVERAVFILREVFGYGYPDVARITGKTEVNCRQIFAAPGSAGRRAPPGPDARRLPPAGLGQRSAGRCAVRRRRARGRRGRARRRRRRGPDDPRCGQSRQAWSHRTGV